MGIAPLDPTPKDKLTGIEIPVAGLDGKACCLAAYESIYKIHGVAQATTSFKNAPSPRSSTPKRLTAPRWRQP